MPSSDTNIYDDSMARKMPSFLMVHHERHENWPKLVNVPGGLNTVVYKRHIFACTKMLPFASEFSMEKRQK